jgi:perosamine synthetase
MFAVLIDEAFLLCRDDLMVALERRSIETRRFFVPIHQQPLCEQSFPNEQLPCVEWLAQHGLYLPSGTGVTDDEVRRVAAAVPEIARFGR